VQRGKIQSVARRRGIGLMPDDVSFLQVNDSLGDAGGMVGDSLEVTRSAHQLKPVFKLSGVSAERFLERVAEPAILPIDRLVAFYCGPSLLGVATD
jgi:hypothetical protein